MTERQLQDAIVEAALWHHWLVFHDYDSRRSQPGYPDLTLCRNGRLIFLELKSDRGRLRPGQQEWIDALAQAPGVTARVVYPADLDDIIALLSSTT